MKPFDYDRADTCPNCKAERSIEGFTFNDKPIRLSLAIDQKRDISNMGIRYLRCSKCRMEFFPKWLNGYPTPMVDSNYIDFLNGYKECMKRAETTR